MFSNNDNSYKKFFVITPDEGENLSTANTIMANQDLDIKLGGEPKRVAELRNGALLVEVQNEQQSIEIKTIKKLHTINVIATEHNTVNKSKGTIYYENKPQFMELEILRTDKFNITDILHFKTKIRGKSVYTDLYILTFDSYKIPSAVKIGWSKLDVREYIPRRRRCFKCQ